MAPQLDELENQGLIWRGSSASRPLQPRASGWQELDQRLGGGWPGNGVVSVKTALGIGELRLLYPAVRQDQGLIVFIAPPYELNAEGLACAGLDLSRILLLRPANNKEALWAAEQCLQSGACQWVCLWQKTLASSLARRLQLAARKGQATHFLFLQNEQKALPVDLNLELSAQAQGLRLAVPRRRQGASLAAFTLTMAERWPELTLPSKPDNLVILSHWRSDAEVG